MKKQKIEKIYDNPINDSRIPIVYNIVNNESLGGGGFGEVFKVQREIPGELPEEQFFALKRIKKEGIINEKDKHYRVLSEIKIQRALNNKYICKYEHSFEDDQAIYIVMEYCERKSLDDYLKTRKAFTEYETRYYMFQVLLGLKYLRQKKVIHRDLTLANLFLKDYKSIKIGDFGLSYIETENEEKPGLMCGTQGYFTPESLQTKYSYKTDIFCLGVCIYHMMTGLTLFKDSISSFETIKKGEIKYDEKTLFSKECKDLFEQIFVFENKRIDLDELFIHPFFNEGIGLIDVDFPNYFDEKMTKKDFEEKIKILEQNVIMTEVSPYPKKNDNLYSSKNHNDNDGISNLKKNVRFNEFNTDNNRINMHPIKKKSNKNVTINLNNNYKPPQKNNDENNINNNIESNQLKENETNIETKLSEQKLPLMILDVLSQKKKEQEEKEEKKEKENNINDAKKPEILNLAETVNENKDKEEEKKINKDKEENENKIDNKINEYENQFFNNMNLNLSEHKKNSDIINAKIEYDNKNNDDINLFQNIYIKNILEENDKAGIGYQLNNDDIGILFNDDSVMTKFPKFKNLIYYRNPMNCLYKLFFPLKSIHEKGLISKINFFNYIIEEAKKKKSRMKFIKNYEKNSKNDIETNYKLTNENNKNNNNKKDIYLLKYKKNAHAYFFLLSNNNIQIRYMDGTDVIFCCSKNKKIIYIEQGKNKLEFELESYQNFCDFKCKESKINKRIKYAIKEIIK